MLARVRNRFAMVRAVEESEDTQGTVSRLVDVEYLDQALPFEDQVVWEIESSAVALESRTLPKIADTEPMRLDDFQAVLRAARWQALLPYRPMKAGIRPVVAPLMGACQVEDYQLIPLARALDMPRVQLGLFDDVGLGKTVEAGLLIAELIRRRRIRRVLVLCPAWLRNQWKVELQSKFGLEFDFIDRETTQAHRRSMGMDANPWRTFPRVIASFGYLRQPDVLQQFEAASKSDSSSPHLPWDLLIVDEVHNAMPAVHGTDSELCRVLQRISRLFEHRVFLSATPHPGFTRAYTGLLEMLDPVRITRADELTAAARERASKIVVRRLKEEINHADESEGRIKRFADRRIEPGVELAFGGAELEVIAASDRFRAALKSELAFAGYGTRTAGNFLLETLAKRLLSCPFTFADSWSRFRLGLLGEESADERDVDVAATSAQEELDDDAESESRTALATELAGMWARSLKLQTAAEDVDQALTALGLDPRSPDLSRNPRRDARYEALREMIDNLLDPSGGWSNDERLIVFSEYRTTTDYLVRRLKDDFPNEPEGRIATLFGGMAEGEREDVKKWFNDSDHPVRIMIATDAAGEGGNLQNCARLLLHYDLPWNPSRIDQRNGRLDRHGQAREVRIFHFTSEQDADLRFMSKLFGKIEVRRSDLGAVSKLFDHAFQSRFIKRESDQGTLLELDDRLEKTKQKVRSDIPRDVEVGQELREEFRQFCEQIDFNPKSLRETIEVALGMGIGTFRFQEQGSRGRYRFPGSIPNKYRDVVDETIRSVDRALPALQFDLEDQLVEQNGRQVFRPPSDAVLMHLGSPLVRRCIASLAAARFPGTKESENASRWVVTRGPIAPGTDAEVRVAVEELALNDLREIAHHWVRTLRFKIKDGVVSDLEPEVVPAHDGVSEWREGSQDAKTIWEDVEDDVRNRIQTVALQLKEVISKHLVEDNRKALQIQQSLFKDRIEEIDRQLSREINAIQREIEKLRETDASLFDPEELDKLLPKTENLEAEQRARREHYQPLRAYLQQEHERLVGLTIPKRYSLRDTVQVMPIGVEIRFPSEVA